MDNVLAAKTTTPFLLGGDLPVNRLGYGAMRITGPGLWGPPADRPAILALLRRVAELGITFIDTADMYGPFEGEKLIAEALHPYPAGLVIGTKGGVVTFAPGREGTLLDGTPQHLHEALHGSLRRLKLERIDLYQLHRLDPRVPAERTFAFLAEAQNKGLVRHLGLSEANVEDIKLAQQHFSVASVQNRYSLFDRAAEPVLAYCREQGIAFIPYFPIGGGQVQETDRVQQVAARHQVSVRQLALSWLLHHAPNILPIPGTTSLAHLEENMRAAAVQLTAQDMQELDALS
ncbi:aldo/keto reductase [Hymenobacter sp. PAMC 26628]|uniref:aldo/keto reductase n=1 Tax=Hymenobacter sp. PAMC 26628 TaxID=1484118 RepID=UPI0007702144|nr:aldo/keto reductase [Hymenobacter sp. PAMC 26628]AMJ67786.1 oxidoreductase [Hymenobacter sp. PAMC 26628]